MAQYHITCLGRQPPVNEAVLIGNPEMEQPPEGWDTLKEKLWMPDPFFLRRGAIRDYTGPGNEQGTFIVQDMRTVDWWAGRPVVEVISQGIAYADGKPYKLECSGGISEDLGLASTASIWRKGYPRVTMMWVSLTTPDLTDHIGVPGMPPHLFGLASGNWSMAYVSDSDWVASGWIGENRSLQQLPGSLACLVTDTWIYDPGYLDRDGYTGIFTP
ncbi:MAG: hypothetical protein ACYC67_10490 [Prosthecobacter sp.]